MEEIRKRLVELRKGYFNMSQKEFAQRMNMPQSTYSPLEKDRQVRDSYIRLICQCYNVSEDWLRNGILPMFNDERDKELDELLNLFDNLSPDLRQFLLKQAKELKDLQEKLDK